MLKTKKNFGYHKNLERCLRYSKGEYIIFLADDDFLLPGIVKKYVEIFDFNKDVGVILCNINQVTEKGGLDYIIKNFSEEKIYKKGEEALSNMLQGLIVLSGIGLRKTHWMHDYQIESLIYPQVEVGAKMLADYSGFALDQTLVALRLHDTTMTHILINHLEQEIDKKSYLPVDIARILRDLNFEPNRQLTNKILNYWLRSLPSVERIMGNRKFVLGYLGISLKNHPYLMYNPNFWFYGGISLFLPKKAIFTMKEYYKKFILEHNSGN